MSDRAPSRMVEAGNGIAFCPTSNMFLGSGLFDLAQADPRRRDRQLPGGEGVKRLKAAGMDGHMHGRQKASDYADLDGSLRGSLIVAHRASIAGRTHRQETTCW